jgi:hypothetical protein
VKALTAAAAAAGITAALGGCSLLSSSSSLPDTSALPYTSPASVPSSASAQNPVQNSPSPFAPGPSTTAPPSSTSPVPVASATAAVTTCTPAHIATSHGQFNGTAGATYTEIVFKNTGSAACDLSGYPGVSLVNAAFGQVGAAASRSPGSVFTLVIAPGDSVQSLLKITDAGNYSQAQCGPAAVSYIKVFAPGTVNIAYLPYKGTGCGNSATDILATGPVAGM